MFLLRLFRIKNLLIVALTQSLVYLLWFSRWYKDAGMAPALSPIEFALLVVCTLCITSGGYVINDIFDQRIDKTNKPEKVVVGKHISEKTAYGIYWSVTGVGFAIAIYLAFQTNNLPWLILYPFAVGMLWMYSRKWKCTPLIGNLVVSFLCAFVIGIVWFAERNTFSEYLHTTESANPLLHSWASPNLLFYLGFAFIATFYRELIKDVQDIKGDMEAGCRTLATTLGPTPVKKYALGIGLALFGLMLVYVGMKGSTSALILLTPALMLTPLCQLGLYQAKETDQFERLSSLAKWIILFGLLFFPLIR